jgi:hypothetical protein
MDLRTLHDWTVRLILRTAPGVDDVTTWGGHEKQFQVQIDPRRLVKYALSFKDVMERLAADNKQVGGQYLNIGAEQYLVRGLGLVSNAAEVGSIVVSERNGGPIYVKDVADVKEAPAVRFGAVTRDGQETVLGIALARINENAANGSRGADRGVRGHAAHPDARGRTDLRRARDAGAQGLRREPGHARRTVGAVGRAGAGRRWCRAASAPRRSVRSRRWWSGA